MATPRKDPKDKLKTGRPVTKPFKLEYCQLLVDHMKEGFSFDSFGATALCGKDQLYLWADVYPEFSEAKRLGTSLSLKFYETLAKMQATGQLRSLKSETPILDSNNRPVMDEHGKPLVKKEYEWRSGSSQMLTLMLKNMHNWREKKDVNVGGQVDAPPVRMSFSGLTVEQMKKRYDELMAKALKK